MLLKTGGSKWAMTRILIISFAALLSFTSHAKFCSAGYYAFRNFTNSLLQKWNVFDQNFKEKKIPNNQAMKGRYQRH